MSVTREGIGMTSQRTRDRLVDRLRQEGIRDERVLTVIGNTPRHLFMDEAISSRAYEDTALPIGHGQTISQPYIVARMTEALLADAMPAGDRYRFRLSNRGAGAIDQTSLQRGTYRPFAGTGPPTPASVKPAEHRISAR